MGKNYEITDYIRKQLNGYSKDIIKAVERLFNIEDQSRECQGCVIDSVVVAIILKCYGVECNIHLGEVCTGGEYDAYHCWVTTDDGIIDIGIYGNSNYNPFYHGRKIEHPVIFDIPEGFKYVDGSTEDNSWLADLSNRSVTDYIRSCPNDRVLRLAVKALDLSERKESRYKIYDLSSSLVFPELKKIEMSPSGRKSIM